ncbi:BTB/POZ domain-containing protein 19 isoform X2 [Phyllostomus hastatus]|uniref:BTB/POZ domain-containing protein 19 isoform X2 n=1 Tax=Phyllostomus hastatus TaxID=9423 RepID=UPI001E6858EA|nr:BTB/POZ domain-containing protein 19 isoform X2 [Phyllostomus hastatus]
METQGLVVHGEAEPFSTALRSLVNNRLYRQGNKGPEWVNAKRGVAPWTPASSPWLSALLSHSDVRFVVGRERQEVFAHRCLLACRCNFFQRLLGPEPGPGVPSPVVLSTVPAEAFLAVLEFLYTNSVKLHRHSVLEVLTAAVEYGLEELREICLEFVVKVLDVELVCEALQVAVTFGLGPLQERCIAFIEAHSQEALRTRGFLELSASALLPLLRSDKLCMDEADLILAARSWARVGAAVLERPVAEVAAPIVRELRLALLAPAELSALEEQNRREPLIPVEQIVEAWKCHAMRRRDAARGASCRRRRGTLPREHHRFLDLPFK